MPVAATNKKKPRKKPAAAGLWNEAQAQSRNLKRGAILRAAAAVLHEKGYHGASLSDIAALLGMTDGALYYYFKNKADLASACVLASYEQAGKWLEKPEGKSGLEKINRFMAHFAKSMARKEIWIPAADPFWLTAGLRKDIQQAASANLTRLAALVREGVGDKSIRWCEPVSTAALIAGALFIGRSWAPYAGYVGGNPEKVADQLIQFVGQSLAASPKGSGKVV